MGRVVIGMDPHKRSATIEVLDDAEQPLMAGRFGTDSEGYRLLLAAGRQFPTRVWAVEGCQGVGRHLAQRLVADGETVLDVPAKLSARARVFSTGQGRKTDATDAHAVAAVALRTPSLRPVRRDDRTVALRLLADRRDELGAARTLTINRLHRLLVELVAGGAKKALTARQARALLDAVPAGDVVTETRRQLADELVDELEVIDARIKTAKKQLAALVAETGSSLMRLNGIGPSGAARLLGDIGDVSRFPTKAHFASWNGTAPLDASSGEQTRHRLSRAGNRRINRALHIMAIVQLRHPTTNGRRYYNRRVAEGKTPMEAMRALKRRLSDVVYRQLVEDQKRKRREQREAGPEGHAGATTRSSAAGSNPNTGASDKSLPGPADLDATPPTSPIPRLRPRYVAGVMCEPDGVAGAAVPSWAVPDDQQVVDCRHLAVGADSYEAGVLATLEWVAGLARSPVTDTDVLASAEAAEAEFFAAGEVEFGVSSRGALVPGEAAQGVGRTLAWLLGWEQRPPVPLPRRPVPSVEQLYEEALAAEPHRTWLPEERNAAWSTAQRKAARLAELAARADAPSQWRPSA